MTFAQTTKISLLSELNFRKPCCRRAFVAGLLFCAKHTSEGLLWQFGSREVADALAEQLAGVYGQAPEIRESYRFGAVQCKAVLRSKSAEHRLAELQNSDSKLITWAGFRCEYCRTQFFKAVFLATGTVSDPDCQNYYLEFLCPDEFRREFLRSALASEGLYPGSVKRKGGFGLYFRRGGGVEDVFRLIGANQILFDIMNVRITKDISNNENRATNCVARNIQKTVKAAIRQVEAIERITDAGRLERMPQELRETAKLRVKHPDVSLEELAALHEPPISKSGLNHRLQRLMEEAESV